jgi:cyanophycinase
MFIIGGHEDKDGTREILSAIAQSLPRPKLVLATMASRHPDGYLDAYSTAFDGLAEIVIVELTGQDPQLGVLDDAGGIFFSGGDQRRIVEQMAATELERRVQALWRDGGVIAGTSAGASALGETMIERGPGDESYRVGEVELGEGLGLVPGVIIDQHFAERGRIGRLVGAVAASPTTLGIGIDENTAIRVQGDRFSVIGDGSVYVIDGRESTHANAASAGSGTSLSFHGVLMNVLSHGDSFDLGARVPTAADR